MRRQERLRIAGSNRPKTVADDRDPAGVSLGTEMLEKSGSFDLGAVLELLSDQSVEGVEDGGGRLLG